MWLYPNRYHIQYRDEATKRYNSETYKYGFGIKNTIDPRTNKNYFASCQFDTGIEETRNTKDTEYIRNKYINSNLNQMPYGNCKSGYIIQMEDTSIYMIVETYVPVVPYIDKVYAQLDGVLKSYIVPTDKTKKVTRTDPQNKNTETKS